MMKGCVMLSAFFLLVTLCHVTVQESLNPYTHSKHLRESSLVRRSSLVKETNSLRNNNHDKESSYHDTLKPIEREDIHPHLNMEGQGSAATHAVDTGENLSPVTTKRSTQRRGYTRKRWRSGMTEALRSRPWRVLSDVQQRSSSLGDLLKRHLAPPPGFHAIRGKRNKRRA